MDQVVGARRFYTGDAGSNILTTRVHIHSNLLLIYRESNRNITLAQAHRWYSLASSWMFKCVFNGLLRVH